MGIATRHYLNQIMMTSWMKTFSALLALCAGNSPVTGEFPSQRPVTQSFDIFVDICLNKRLSKQSRGWWFETLSRSLWRHRNVFPRSRCDISFVFSDKYRWMRFYVCQLWDPSRGQTGDIYISWQKGIWGILNLLYNTLSFLCRIIAH